mgnify:CR=1 FL=1
MPDHPEASQPFSVAAGTWGVVGVGLLLTQAVVRLTPIALEPIVHGGLTTGCAVPPTHAWS